MRHAATMRQQLFAVLAPVLTPILLAACSGDGNSVATEPPLPVPTAPVDPPKEPPPPETRTFVPTKCRFAVPASVEGTPFRCADLLVPENREKAGSRTIKVHVIIFKGKAGGVPTIELNGGPGGSSEMIVNELSINSPRAMAEYGRFLELGDLVLFDQRGVGRSDPSLSCDEGMNGGSPAACAAALTKRGIDLTGYVTSESADDVHALKEGLGVPKINLHGISYGTRLALEILRRHPADVAASVIDGVVPAQARLLSDNALNLDAVVTRTFESCAADTKCASTYPNLDATLDAVKTKLETTPFQSAQYGPYDWYAFSGELFQRLYAEGTAGRLPFELHDLATKTQEKFAADEATREKEARQAWEDDAKAMAALPLGKELEARITADPAFEEAAYGFFTGMHLSVLCSDHGQYESLDDALAATAKVRPALRDADGVRFAFADCEAWPKRAKTAQALSAIASAQPVLVIGGEVDPATPYRWAADAAKSLSSSQLIEMKGGAHGAMDTCALDLKLAFLRTGAVVDATCTKSRKLEFYYPAPPGFAQQGAATGTAASSIAAARKPWTHELPWTWTTRVQSARRNGR